MRAYAIKNGYSLNEKELLIINKFKKYDIISEKEYINKIQKPYPMNEEDIFKFLGLKYIKPSNRQSGMIIEL